jgi:hypothetical protein
MPDAKSSYKITFLTRNITAEEKQKILMLVDSANNMIQEYFGIQTSFDILICRGRLEMEVQIISRRHMDTYRMPLHHQYYDDTKSIGITDYELEEIIIRFDAAKFGHYLHELIHGIISKDHPHQLREGLAWYFTLKLTDSYRYVRSAYPSWVDQVYVYPVKKLARIVGDDFLKDFALGRALLEESALAPDIQDLFLPAELFYSKRRYY